MNKKMILFIAIIILSITIVVEVGFAVDSVKLIINGKEISPWVPLQIVNNRVIAPVRQIAEALGATVEWDDENKTVKIVNKTQLDMEKRLDLLEIALVSQNPEEIANTWAKGVMSRNGALQYAVLCDNLRSKYKSNFETWDWWTGASSPWVDSYEVSTGEQQLDGTWKFIIKFHYTDSTKNSYSSESTIYVGLKKIDNPPLPVYPGSEQKWCIIRITN